ncbi:MAG: hypothetical protein JWM36_3883 [Hyphomicrobiales bacterium]|nr:hypothetical protein [Hyphomicrobiales bacterium]
MLNLHDAGHSCAGAAFPSQSDIADKWDGTNRGLITARSGCADRMQGSSVGWSGEADAATPVIVGRIIMR